VKKTLLIGIAALAKGYREYSGQPSPYRNKGKRWEGFIQRQAMPGV